MPRFSSDAIRRLSPATIVLLALAGSATAAEFPRFGIEATCRKAPQLAGGVQNPYPGCVKDETAARAELENAWSTFDARRRAECVAETGIEGSPSYVDVLTCLRMYAADPSSPRPPRRPERRRE